MEFQRKKILKENDDALTGEDVREGITAVVSAAETGTAGTAPQSSTAPASIAANLIRFFIRLPPLRININHRLIGLLFLKNIAVVYDSIFCAAVLRLDFIPVRQRNGIVKNHRAVRRPQTNKMQLQSRRCHCPPAQSGICVVCPHFHHNILLMCRIISAVKHISAIIRRRTYEMESDIRLLQIGRSRLLFRQRALRSRR